MQLPEEQQLALIAMNTSCEGNDFMIYNVSFDICAAIISVFSLFTMLSIKKDLHKSSNRVLLLIIIASFVACVFDIWSSVGNSYVEQYSYFYRDVLNYIFLFVYVDRKSVV